MTIFASSFDHSTKTYRFPRGRDDIRVETIDGVTFVWLRTTAYSGNGFGRILSMFSYAVKTLNASRSVARPDVIVGSSMHPLAPTVAWRLSRRFRVPFVFEIRDLWPQTAIDMGVWRESSIQAKALYAWEKLMCREARKVITLMPYASVYLVERGVAPGKIVWISNGVDTEAFDVNAKLELPESVRAAVERPNDEFLVLYTGAHGRPNGLDQLIDAAFILKGLGSRIRIVLVGDGTEKARLAERASTLGLDSVQFCPPVKKQYVAAILSTADCLVVCVPRHDVFRYGISLNKLFDYMASGKPIVLAGDVPNDLVKDANAGMTVPGDSPQRLADALLEMARRPRNEILRLGRNGRKFVEQRYSVEVLSVQFERLLDEVLR